MVNNWKKIIFITVALVVIVGAISMINTYQTNNKIARAADDYVKTLEEITHRKIINGKVLISKDDNIILNKAYGVADIETNRPFQANDQFLVCSLTKPITTIAIMQLYEQGKLNLQDPVSQYIPQQVGGDKITIEHLLKHTSGIVRDPKVDFEKELTQVDIFNSITSTPLDYEPGQRYQYSNAGYILLGHIIQEVSGMTYKDYLNQNVFKPAEMNHTAVINSFKDFPKNVAGHEVLNHTLVKIKKEEQKALPLFIGAGNIKSSPMDYYKLHRSLSSTKLLTSETSELMNENEYAFSKIQLHGKDFYIFNGQFIGYSTTILRAPSEDLVVIIFMNVGRQHDITTYLGKALATIALEEPYELPGEKEKSRFR